MCRAVMVLAMNVMANGAAERYLRRTGCGLREEPCGINQRQNIRQQNAASAVSITRYRDRTR